MFRWRHRQPAYMDEQNRAETDMTSAVFLLVAGRLGQAAELTERILARPDRQSDPATGRHYTPDR